MSMELIEQSPVSCSHCLGEKQKTMLWEEDSNSTRDSNSTTDSNSTISSDSPPHKQPRLLTPKEQKTILSEEGDNSSRDFNSSRYFQGILSPCHPLDMLPQLLSVTLEELEKIKSGDAEAKHLKDYVDWFMSLAAEDDENDVFWPGYYGKWFSTLEAEAKADYIQPFQYTEWYVERFGLDEPDEEFPDMNVVRVGLIERCGQLALEYFNTINKCDDYEYVRDVAIRECDDSYHLNFYGRLKVSPSGPEPESPLILFFADVDFEDIVLECRILDSEKFGDAQVLHPPGAICPDRCGPNLPSRCNMQ